jgi:hypothetical protein
MNSRVTDSRRRQLATLIEAALRRPLTAPGSQAVADATLSRFPPDTDIIGDFAEKALETLDDGAQHNRMAITSNEPHVAVLFVAWNGTHREMQPERYGRYLNALFRTARGLVDRDVALAGFLEIDAFVRHAGDGTIAVDVELSFLPGGLLGFPQDRHNPLPKALIINTSLLADEERQALANVMD